MLTTWRSPLVVLVALLGIVGGLTLLRSDSGQAAFCAHHDDLGELLERGADGHADGVVEFAEDLRTTYVGLRDSAPDDVQGAAAVAARHNLELIEHVVQGRGDMFSVVANLPPGTLRGDELRAAEAEIRSFVADRC